MSVSSAFISYHHEDKIIGEAVYDELLHLSGCGKKGKDAVKCFLDVRDIDTGKPWQPVIDQSLKNSDWLVVVFTGEQSVYCGYEIGTFSQIAQIQDAPTRRIVGLHDVADLPIILKDRQNVYVNDIVMPVSEQKDVTMSTDEVDGWYESRVGKFLRDFCEYDEMYTANDDAKNYVNNIALSAKKIANAFAIARRTDVKDETPVQISFEITIKGRNDTAIDKIPNDADVLGTSLFFNALGLSVSFNMRNRLPPVTTWAGLKQMLLQNNKICMPWMNKVESDIISAINNGAISGDDAVFRGDNNKIYQPILDRHKLYMNGDRRFYLMFVETPDRKFKGFPRTSLLLSCLVLASRWRFLYLENWSETMRAFGKDVSLKRFTTACIQLDRNINSIEVESAELGTVDRHAMIEAFGENNRAQVEQLFKDWEDAKKALYTYLPKTRSEITQKNRGLIENAVTNFLRSTRQQNVEVLRMAIDVYGEQVKNLEIAEYTS